MDPGRPQAFASLNGSPGSIFRARIAAELADGSILPACPHPATANVLSLPSRILRCGECEATSPERPDSEPGPCAACGAPGIGTWTAWLSEAARVLVTARVCEPCQTSGNVPLSLN
jgi:hypothetical protein